MRTIRSFLLNSSVSDLGVHGENKLMSGKICYHMREVTDCKLTCHQGNLQFYSKRISTWKVQDVAYTA